MCCLIWVTLKNLYIALCLLAHILRKCFSMFVKANPLHNTSCDVLIYIFHTCYTRSINVFVTKSSYRVSIVKFLNCAPWCKRRCVVTMRQNLSFFAKPVKLAIVSITYFYIRRKCHVSNKIVYPFLHQWFVCDCYN